MSRKHSIISASASHRWLNCPGSIRMQAGMPDTTSEAAKEGTAAHEVAEKCLMENVAAAKYLGAEIEVEGSVFLVTQEMVDGVQMFLDIVRQDYVDRSPGVTLEVEKEFVLDWLNDNLFGRNDALVGQDFGLLSVYDLKYGKGLAVDAEDNNQMMIYALGALHGSSYEEVELVIVQPRAPHSEGPVRRWRISEEDLVAWGEKVLKPGAEAALGDEAEICAGDWCRWCKAIAICPAVREQAVELAKVAFDDDHYVMPLPKEMTGAEIARVLHFSEVFSSWVNDVKDFAKTELERGRDVPGYKLVRGRKTRKWTDEAEVIRALAATYKAEIYEDPKLRSVAQMEKVIKKAGGDPDAALAGIVEITRAITLAPESDKREAYVPALEAFNDEEK